jgi:hypothetical protein
MKIYLLTRTDSFGYDDFVSAVVIAKNEVDAITIHPSGNDSAWENKNDAWCKQDKVKAEYVGTANKQQVRGVLLSSFNAG